MKDEDKVYVTKANQLLFVKFKSEMKGAAFQIHFVMIRD